ncbi:MAG: RNA polymerase sigma factor [Pseudomonadales bacterium]|nr:RNA polymerase sigma factor [Pseudomonadales bacterium]MCP5358211.1 RNA polymerase sigma factor [Pseudomonadales bacterium]
MSEELEHLIRASQGGDLQSFRKLHAQFVGRAYGICLRLLADAQKAEDACQETFLKVWQQLPQFRGDSSFSTWLHSIATRTAIDLWRKDRVLRLVDEGEPDEHPGSSAEQISDDLEKAIASLPAQARAVFVLFALEGYTHPEIGKLLGIAEGSSKAHYHRARQLLQERFGER